MKYKTLIYCLLLSVYIIPASASDNLTYDSYTHTIELIEKNSYQEINAIINVSETLNEFYLNLPLRIENLKVLIDEKEATYYLERKTERSILRIVLPEKKAKRHFISITYDTNYPIFELENKILYKSEYIPTNKTTKFDYILKLPVGYVIPEEKNVSFFINPKPKSIYSDGRRIILLWELKDVITTFEISVLMEPVSMPWLSIPGTSWLIILIILLCSGLLFYSKKVKQEKITYPALVEHEKIIVDLLKKAEGNDLWQKQIQVQSGFSKVKVSRILQSLEKRGVIKKVPWGNTNKIHLINEPDKKVQETSEK